MDPHNNDPYSLGCRVECLSEFVEVSFKNDVYRVLNMDPFTPLTAPPGASRTLQGP